MSPRGTVSGRAFYANSASSGLPAASRLTGQNGKPDYLSVVIRAFHHCVVSCLAHITGPLGKTDFQKVALAVVPDFHFIGVTCFPFFGLSVRVGSEHKSIFLGILSTTQSHLSPTPVPK